MASSSPASTIWHPLSSVQREIWFDQALYPEAPVYNITAYLRIQGALDRTVFHQALTLLVKETDVLRMRMTERDNVALQAFPAMPEVVLGYRDLSDAGDPMQAALIEIQQAANQRFRIFEEPVFRFTLYKLSDDLHLWLQTYHHLIMDGASGGLMVQRLASLYNALLRGEAIPDKPGVSYLEFVESDAAYLASDSFERHRQYWQTKFSTIPEPLLSPKAGYANRADVIPSGAYTWFLSRATYAQLEALAKEHSVSVFHALLGIFYVLFTRLQDRDECVIGLPVLNRNTQAFKQTIGLFVSVMPSRFSHGKEISFTELMQAIAKTLREAYRYQRFPVSEINRLAGVFQAGRKRLFDLSLSFIKQDYAAHFDSGAEGENVFVIHNAEQLPLAIYVGEYSEEQDIQFDFSYNLAYFDEEEIRSIQKRITRLLEDVLEHPERSIAKLDILLPEERRKLLIDWNLLGERSPFDKLRAGEKREARSTGSEQARSPFDKLRVNENEGNRSEEEQNLKNQKLCAHELFEEQVLRTPEATAVVFEAETLSYTQLNARANQLAHTLMGLGVGPDVLVAIALERSPEMIIALLAVMKAGGAYVPLDPAYPSERLAFMLEDSGAKVLLTQESLRTQWPRVKADILCLDTDWTAIDAESEANPPRRAQPENLAYVIYTSGSTGRPKGVMIEHGGLTNYLCWAVKAYGLESGEFVPVHTSISFDLTITSLYPPLLAGGCLELLSDTPGVSSLLEALRNCKMSNLIKITPAHLELLNRELDPDEVAQMSKVIVIGGENLLAENLSLWRHNAVGTRLINEYGPTETVVGCCVYELQVGDPHSGSVPIGRPIANTRLYVLDRRGQLVPIGVPGELYIGGVGLARGYLNRPELTAEKFIPNPFSEVPGERLYKTGDLVRYRSDGNLEFLGRLDHQVKIRGFRIELGEIEAALVANPSIHEAVVIARKEESGGQRLVAYLVAGQRSESVRQAQDLRKREARSAGSEQARSPFDKLPPSSEHPGGHSRAGENECQQSQNESIPSQPAISELRNFLKTTLPEYMVPSAFVFLPALPLTPNGKVDRKALPEPEAPATKQIVSAPRDALEEILVGLWATVLRVPTPGRDGNFFELGGHSLLATQLASRIRDALRVDVPVRWLFESPTVAEAAERLRPVLAGNPTTEENGEVLARTIVPVPRDRPLPQSFAQQRLWFLDQLEGPSATYNMPGALEITGALDLEALSRALSEIVRRHESLRTCLTVQNGEPVQVIQPAQPLEVQVFDLRHFSDPDGEAKRQALEEARLPFDLTRDLPLRTRLLQREDQAWTLLLTLHHSAADGWSISILIRELVALYGAYRLGQPSPLPELALQYADFAVWQRAYLSGDRLKRQVEVWRARLAGSPQCLDLPTDRPRPVKQSYRGATVCFTIETELSASLQALSQRSGSTLFMTLLAAWANLLARYSGAEDLVIGSPVANRTLSAIEPLIGFFVNTLALRADLSGNPSFLELLARLRSVCLEAYAHQELPFESLVEALGVPRNLSHAPLFQVMFVLQNNPEEKLVLPGLEITLVETESTVAKFDLTLSIAPNDGALDATLEYATDLFDQGTIERMAGHFVQLLRSVVAGPDRTIGELEILTPKERRQLLIDWNSGVGRSIPRAPGLGEDSRQGALGIKRPTSDVESSSCVHELFEVQVLRTPEATAVVFEAETLSYTQLNARANQLAHALIKLGVGPDVLVAIALERSMEMIVALMATLKAGGAYVPLDPDYPSERLAFMLEDCGAKVLITQESLRPRFSLIAQHCLLLDTGWAALALEPKSNPPPRALPENLAYVIYTSGSTGKPKGVLVEHRNVVQLLFNRSPRFDFAADEVWVVSHSFCFDFSVWEMYGALLLGGRLAIARRDEVRDIAEYVAFVRDHRVSVLNQTPAAFYGFIEEALRQDHDWGAHLRYVIFGGDRLEPSYLKRWAVRFPTVALINMYGITETTVHVSFYRLTAADLDCAGRSPIGRPLPETTVYVCDRFMSLQPIGVPGEILVGGSGVARGYLNRPELTAERFVADPFEPGGRLYRSGDLARYLADGSLEYLGRIDSQVKVRGFRIELGEIEAALVANPAIREAVVVARKDENGGQRLVAYLVAGQRSPFDRLPPSSEHFGGHSRAGENGSQQPQDTSISLQPTIGELRTFLKETLPEYMVPSAFVFLSSLPLTSNGKVDRKALPVPEASGLEAAHEAPRDVLEEILVGLWATVLRVPEPGREGNFFELGGHSLLATQLASRIRDALGVEVPVRWLFEAPTVAQLATRVRPVLAGNPTVEDRSEGLARTIVPVPRDRPLPQSFAQQRLWFLDQLEGPSATYNMPGALEITGDLDIEALCRALSEIVRRHESLRTCLVAEGGEPVQVIVPYGATVGSVLATRSDTPSILKPRSTSSGQARVTSTLPTVDLRHYADPDIEAKRQAQEEALRPFDLARDLPIRARLLQREERTWTLLLTLHHSAADGWSISILIRELVALYGAYRLGQPSPLSELTLQYADFALWQRAYLTGERFARQVEVWRARLAGAPECLALPTDRSRPVKQRYRGASLSFTIDPELTGSLQALSQRSGSTLFMTLLAAWANLLARYSGSEDLVIGSPVANRTQSAIEPLIGFFVNTLALRADLSGNPSFLELLARLRQVCLEAYAHQELPFESLVEALGVPRNLSHAPLFQVMFVLQNNPEGTLGLPGLEITLVETESTVAKFDLTLSIAQIDGAFSATLEYATDLFDRGTIVRMAGHYLQLLRSVVARPELSIGELEILTAAERRQLLVEWNATTTESLPQRCVHELFEEQVLGTPEATAVVFEEEVLSYTELNRRANQLAHHLIDLGVGPDDRVAIALERSPELIVALLGTLKAGGAYVPLDPAYPSERLAFMWDDCGAKVLITQKALKERFERFFDQDRCQRPEARGRRSESGGQELEKNVLCLDTDWAEIAVESEANPQRRSSPESLAYIMYTSGSTGRPKGICIPHRGIVRLVRNNNYFEVAPQDVFLQLASISFDASTFEIWASLLNGSRLVVPSPERPTFEKLGAVIRQHQVSILFLTTALFQSLVDGYLSYFGSVRQLFTGGEVMSPRHALKFLRERPECQLANIYGPTENTTFTSYYPIRSLDQVGQSVPIGRPISHTSVYVLDAYGEPVSIGIPGELYTGGAGLALAYHNRPDLTAEKFIGDPFSSERGARLYRTGDLVRYLPDGNLEFLGRLDHQVKIRGFRIELGEIESALVAHSLIREAVVVACKEESGGQRLVAYLVVGQRSPFDRLPPSSEHFGGHSRAGENGSHQSKDFEHPTVAELRSFLKATLPEYMVPSAFVFLPSLPLTSNGKVDRKALPVPEASLSELGSEAPRDALEEILVGLWATVLRVPTPGRDGNFFELGGHSLLATQLASRIRDALGVEIPVRRIFEAPTVAELAARLRPALADNQTAEDKSEVLARTIVPVPRDRPLPLSFAQQRLWFLDQLEGPSATYNMPGALEITGELDIDALRSALSEIVRRHESLRTCLVSEGGEPHQVIVPHGSNVGSVLATRGLRINGIPERVTSTLPTVDLRKFADPAGEAKRLALEEARLPFDLTRDLPLRTRLLQREDQAWTLLLTLHHSEADGWSISVLIRELVALYGAYRLGQPSPLSELALQYADFAVWQRAYLSGERRERHIGVWRNRLAGAPECLALPTDRPRPVKQRYRGASLSFTIDPELTGSLQALSRRSGSTLFMTLLAAWANLLARYSGSEDLVIGSPVANRTQSAIEPLIGFFVNTLALRADLSGNPSFLELLARLRQVCLEAYAHQEIPFESLVESLGVPRNLSHAPLFQVMFVLQNNPEEKLALPDLEIALVETESAVAKFDLTLSIAPGGGALEATLEYATDLFDRSTIERMAGHFVQLLQSVVAKPEQAIGDLEILTPKERRQLLIDWTSEVGRSIPRAPGLGEHSRQGALGIKRPISEGETPCCVHELFETQVLRTPEAIAVVFEDEELSYAELNRRANRLAHALMRLGVGPDDRVAIALERSPGMIVALLGTLKAGGAYVPLDPDYPAERLAFMREDCGAKVLITQENLRSQWSQGAEHILCQDTERASLAAESEANPPRRTMPENLAYVIYTSGSTGKPKGVAVEHQSIAYHCQTISAYYELSSRDRVFQFASFSFDTSAEQILPTLCSGAAIVLAPAGLQSVETIDICLRQYDVTVLDLPPAFFRVCGESCGGKLHLQLRLIILGGDVLTPEVLTVRSHWNKPWPRLVNAYGPTEATVTTTCYEVPELPPAVLVPIGRPLPQRSVYVLDKHMKLVPIGVPGELYIGGEGLARGYLNRPELTAEKFIPNPFSKVAGERLYKTGDLVRYRPDGDLEFLGRLDHQVKIRGFRIELGEIEAALVANPAIREAVVVARKDDNGGQRLVAYLVAGQRSESVRQAQDLRKREVRSENECQQSQNESFPSQPAISELRNFLKTTLPEYMVPSAFVFLPSLPLTPNGKVDRKALPEPEAPAATQAVTAPRDALEEILVGLWATVLRVPEPGRDGNFFELGGHSLLATQLASRIRDALGVEVPVRWLFEAPTVAELAERLRDRLAGARCGEAISAIPANLIEPGTTRITPELLPLVTLTQAEIDQVVGTVEGGAGNIQDIYPLAPLQEGILFHHQLQKEGDTYLSHALIAFDNPERCQAFIKAFQSVVDRHDILRTAVVWEKLAEPVQVVWRKATLPVENMIFDSAKGPIAEQLVEQCHPRHTRLDLTRAPLLRMVQAKEGERTLLLLLSHHLVMDHTTLEVLFEEIVAHEQGQEQHLSAPVPFRTFAMAARTGVAREEHEAFFREMLGDIDTPTTPFNLSDVQGDGSTTVEERRELPAELALRLRAQSQRLGATPAALFHLAWALVLSRCCSQDDVVFGTVLFGRLHGGAGIERALGLFINTLPIRIACDERPVADALRDTQRRLLALMGHEQAPLSLAQRCSAVPVPAPLFSSLLNYRHSPAPADASRRLEGVELLLAEERSNYPFGMSVDDLGLGFGMTAQVDLSVDPARICSFMQRSLEVLVEALEKEPQTLLCELDILPPAEKKQLLIDWNPSSQGYAVASVTATELPPSACVHELFEAQVLRMPESTAVVFEDERLTYAELNRRANQLARALIRLGVGPDVLVAIALERSMAMIVALMATLKAGGAYVPLDPDYPPERLAFMLEDCGAKVLLTQESLRTQWPHVMADIICLDTDWPGIDAESEANPPRRVMPENLAYVIYTSGSTGRPKGVAIEHRSISDHCQVIREHYGLSSNDRVYQSFSFGFDASVEDTLTTLCSGAALVLARYGLHAPEDLDAAIERHRLTLLHLPPAFFQQWIALGRFSERTDTVRLINVGGDVFPKGSLEPWRHSPLRVKSAIRLINGYGPTEVTVHTCMYDVPDTVVQDSVPIGRPLASRAVYVLDRHLQPTPVGVPGELYIGGVGVARGYLNRSELTAQKLIPDPFSSKPGARLYRTGDLVRYLPDGNLEFLGRLDHQVKIRGFRIELGEIESALVANPMIREAVVVAHKEESGGQRLVAYLVAGQRSEKREARSENESHQSKNSEQPTLTELRAFLKTTLPEYMVPAAFVWLPALPLTPNGKVDRKALPEPEFSASEDEAEAPKDAVEEILVGLWAVVLRHPSHDRNGNFFELGGHSLLATQLVSRIRDAFGMEVPVRWLFEAPTVAELAVRLRAGLETNQTPEDKYESQARTIVPVPREKPFPLSFAQQRLWFLDQLEGPSATYNMPGVLELAGTLDVGALSRAISEIVRRHESLRTCLVSEGGEPHQVIVPHGSNVGSVLATRSDTPSISNPRVTSTLPTLDLRQCADPVAEAKRLAQEEALLPFDLARDLPIRARLLQRQDRAWTLLLTLHHSASDGWSLSVLIRELVALYTAYRSGQLSPLPELAIQYADFALWQRAYLSGDRLKRHIGVWRNRLAGAPECLALPTDRPRPVKQSYRGASLSFTIDPELTGRLQALSQRSGSTLFMTLLAAWANLLARYSGSEDLVIGSPVANRTQSAIEPLIGFFVNTLALRADLSDNPSFLDLLARLRQVCLEAYAHQEIPFESLVESLGVPRNLSHAPLFQVMFVLQNNPEEKLTLPDLEIALVETESTVAKFDLTLSIAPRGGALEATLEYATDLFDRSTIERMAGHFVQLLSSVVATPGRAIGELEILPAAEKQRLLVEWNRLEERSEAVRQAQARKREARSTGSEQARSENKGRQSGESRDTGRHEACVHELFEAQVLRTPEATVVVFEDEQLSYAQLNARANQLAHALIRLGVGSDDRVAIALERSPEMIIALLAVMKAGGAYVPLDPDYPSERLAFMLEDSGAKVLVTQESLKGRFASFDVQDGGQWTEDSGRRTEAHSAGSLLRCATAGTAGQVGGRRSESGDQELENVILCLDTDWAGIGTESEGNPTRRSAPENLAYVIYTSGSTGRPKGVAVEHRGLSNFLVSMQREPGINPGDTLLAVTTMSFDIFGLEIYLPLVNGSRVILGKASDASDPVALSALLQRHDVTILQATPSTWRMLIDAGWSGKHDLKILVGGEALAGSLAKELLTRGSSLWNLYGPTETTIWSSLYQVELTDTDRVIVHIGRPIANTQLYVLNGRGQLVPIGVPGELYIGGVGLARGYLNRPELTAEKFIPDPFSVEPGARLYRTGDLVRYRPDGNLEFLGRLDHQVKIRGFRIELGEIESALSAHPLIREAVVVARKEEGGGHGLVAYLVGATDPEPSVRDLRAFLKTTLPEHMVPSAFVFLSTLPLTPNGKVDRKALPEPGKWCGEDSYFAPRDALEQQLVQIGEELLSVSPLGIEDNFFEKGGHSLMAVRLIAEIEKRVGRRIPVSRVFEFPTIAELASLLRKDGERADVSCLVRIRSRGVRSPIFFLPGAGGQVGYLYSLARLIDPEIPFYAFQSQGMEGKAEPIADMDTMAAHFVSLLREVQPEGPYYLAGHSAGGLVAFAMAQLLLSRGERIGLLMIVDTFAPGAISIPEKEKDDVQLLIQLANQEITLSPEELKGLESDKLFAEIAHRLKEAKLLPEGVETELLRRFLRIYRTNVKIQAQYSPVAYQPLPITLVRASEAMADQRVDIAQDEDLGWSRYSSEPVAIHYVPGDHGTMMRSPHVTNLAQLLGKMIG